MSGIILLGLKTGVVIFGVVGVAKVLNWYHQDETVKEKGGKIDDKHRPTNRGIF